MATYLKSIHLGYKDKMVKNDIKQRNTPFKGTVFVIYSKLPCKYDNFRFATVPLIALSD